MPIAKRSFVSAFDWDPRSSRYRRRATGQFVSRDAIRGALEGALRTARREMDSTSRLLQSGAISVADWRERMAAHIKATHLYSAAMPRGGWAQLTAADFGRVGRLVRIQYEYLSNFAAQLAAGLPTDGRFLTRSRMYQNAAREVYHESERVEMRDEQGMTEERNILANADNCDGCLVETSRDWVPIGSLKPIGRRTCLTNCLCRIKYR